MLPNNEDDDPPVVVRVELNRLGVVEPNKFVEGVVDPKRFVLGVGVDPKSD